MESRATRQVLILVALASTLPLHGCWSWQKLELEAIEREPAILVNQELRLTTQSSVLILTVRRVEYPHVHGRLKLRNGKQVGMLGRDYMMDMTQADRIEILEFDWLLTGELVIFGPVALAAGVAIVVGLALLSNPAMPGGPNL